MSKKLYLMRHAKSSWREPLPDRERPLNRRGKRAAKRIGEALRQRGVTVDSMFSSDARRARSTAKRIRKALRAPREILRSVPELYDADASALLRFLHTLDDRWNEVLVVAHNPGISDLAVALSGDERFDWLPTGALVGLEFDLEHWSGLGGRKGRVVLVLKPRELEGNGESSSPGEYRIG